MSHTIFRTACLTALLFIYGNLPAQIISYKKTGFGINCLLKQGAMNIYILKDDIVEVKYTSLQHIEAKKSLVVIPVNSFLKNLSVTEKDNQIVISTAKLKIRINKNSEAITYTDLQNNVILAEANENNKVMRDTTVAGIQTYSCATSFQSP